MTQSYIILAQVMPIKIDLQWRPICLVWSSSLFLGNLLAHTADRERDGTNHEEPPNAKLTVTIMEGNRDRTR